MMNYLISFSAPLELRLREPFFERAALSEVEM